MGSVAPLSRFDEENESAGDASDADTSTTAIATEVEHDNSGTRETKDRDFRGVDGAKNQNVPTTSQPSAVASSTSPEDFTIESITTTTFTTTSGAVRPREVLLGFMMSMILLLWANSA